MLNYLHLYYGGWTAFALQTSLCVVYAITGGLVCLPSRHGEAEFAFAFHPPSLPAITELTSHVIFGTAS